MSDAPKSEFADYLRAQEILNAAQVKRLLARQAESKTSLARAALDLGFLDEAGILTAWAEMNGSGVLSRADLKAESEALRLVPRESCVRHSLLPLRIESGVLVVATSDPTNPIAGDDLMFLTGLPVSFRAAASDDIANSIAGAYPPEIAAPLDSAGDEDSPVIREVQRILQEAVDRGASHVHLEPAEGGVLVLLRIRGVLREERRIPSGLQAGITARLKILGELDIAERHVPQVGKIRLNSEGRAADFMIATLPTAFHRERITLRRLGAEPPVPRPEELGFGPDVASSLTRLLNARRGLFIVAGEAESGRTTTLYSLACAFSKAGRKVLSVEEGVLRRMSEFIQVVPTTKARFPASMAVRHAIRQDLDVLMIDSGLDAELLETALGGAASGRLILAGMVAPSAFDAVERMSWMLGDRGGLSQSLLAVLGQNLVRLLCPSCKAPEPLPAETSAKYGIETGSSYVPKGCSECDGSGFAGRAPLGQFLRVDDDWKRCLDGGWVAPPANGKRDWGRDALVRAGVALVGAGRTSLEEVLGRHGIW